MRREVFPVEGIVTGMRISTFFVFDYCFIYYCFSSFYIDSRFWNYDYYPSSSISLALELTISINFSFVIFFSTNLKKLMKRLLIYLEMGLF